MHDFNKNNVYLSVGNGEQFRPLYQLQTKTIAMQPVIYPVEKEKLIAELTEERFVRTTNKAGNEIYIFDAHSAPNLMREVGRIRELTFRSAGGGTCAAER